MGKVLILLVVLAAVLGVSDVEARIYTQHVLEKRVDAKVTSSGAHVSISSFPFVGRIAASGTIPKIRIAAGNVTAGPFDFQSIVVTATGVRLDRTALFNDQRVVVQRIDTGTVTADLNDAGLDRILAGLPVKLIAGGVQLTVAGVTVRARVSLVANRLHFDAAGIPVSVPIPTLPLLPCAANAVATPGRLEISCTFHQIPAALLITPAPAPVPAPTSG